MRIPPEHCWMWHFAFFWLLLIVLCAVLETWA
jgi:hypothetical protein